MTEASTVSQASMFILGEQATGAISDKDLASFRLICHTVVKHPNTSADLIEQMCLFAIEKRWEDGVSCLLEFFPPATHPQLWVTAPLNKNTKGSTVPLISALLTGASNVIPLLAPHASVELLTNGLMLALNSKNPLDCLKMWEFIPPEDQLSERQIKSLALIFPHVQTCSQPHLLDLFASKLNPMHVFAGLSPMTISNPGVALFGIGPPKLSLYDTVLSSVRTHHLVGFEDLHKQVTTLLESPQVIKYAPWSAIQKSRKDILAELPRGKSDSKPSRF